MGMVTLFTVTAPARSGTKWFSDLFTTDRSFCYHELTTHLHPYPSNVALDGWLREEIGNSDSEDGQRRLVLQGYPDYFKRLWERTNYGEHIVGNSDSGTVKLVRGLSLLWPDMKFVFVIRNGINWVQSHFSNQANVPPSVMAELKARWNSEDYFEICCQRWTGGVSVLSKSKAWLAERGGEFAETGLEAVTTSLDELHRVWDWLRIGEWERYAERNAGLMHTPINARTNVQRVVPAEEIWASWTDEQRRKFESVCGSTMLEHAYGIPW